MADTSPTAPPAAVQPTGQVVSDTVDKTRAWTGFLVVGFGDAAIALAAILGVTKLSGGSQSGSEVVAILTSAFTAVGTLTTAYFGIRAMSNTAQSHFARAPAPQGESRSQEQFPDPAP